MIANLFRQVGARPELGVVVLMALVLSMLVVPLPTVMIDTLIGINIALSIVIFVGSFYMTRILDFSTFPSVLLITTLFRLALSITTTRMILLQADAGQIIATFGEFVIGADLAIGVVVFAIVTLVQFIVITKGAERVAEVCARFALDGLPGRQMSIDGDVRAGLITGEQAKDKRRMLEKESQLYGSMDGTMKFIKGDAIAGIVIIMVNFVGGIWIGVARHGLSFSEALDTYTLLTVGDGLVAQIPALLIAVAAGFIVTRVSDDGDNLGAKLIEQLFRNNAVVLTAAGLIGLIGFLPGFPTFVFLGISGVLASIFYVRKRAAQLAADPDSRPVDGMKALLGKGEPASDKTRNAVSVDQIIPETVPLMIFTAEQHSEYLLGQDIKGNFKLQLFIDLGVKIPDVEVRARPGMPLNRYELQINEIQAGEFHVLFSQQRVVHGADMVEALGVPSQSVPDSGGGIGVWVDQAIAADLQGTDVFLRSDLDEMYLGFMGAVSKNIGEFFGIQEAKNLLDDLEKKYPELLKETYRHATIQRIAEVLQRLLLERISIRNLKGVLEAVAQWAPKERDTIMLVEHVRGALARYISAKFSRNGRLAAIVLSPEVEELIRQGIRQTSNGTFLNLDPLQSDRIMTRLDDALSALHASTKDMVILTGVDVRRFVKRMVEGKFPDLQVISYGEIAETVAVDILKSV